MSRMNQLMSYAVAFVSSVAVSGLLTAGIVGAADSHMTAKFEGIKANKGMAIHTRQGNEDVLTWSDDYKVPDTPAPHWQVVDAQGNVYLLNQQRIKGDKQNKSIVLPPYVHVIAKVQVWCSFAEALLGEASFAVPIKTASGERASSMMSAGR